MLCFVNKGVIYIKVSDTLAKFDRENLVDYHLHTKFSDDSLMCMEELVDAAVKKGIKKLCVTDHIEPESFHTQRHLNKLQLQKDLDASTREYLTELSKLKRKNESIRDIKILKGVELGLSPETLKESELYVKSYSFDFVLASLHAVGGVEVNHSSVFESRSKNEVFESYLEELYRCIKEYEEFDSLAHLDLVRRYYKRFKGKNEIIYTPELSLLVDDILKLIKEKGKGLEVNSSGYRYGLLTPMPSFEVIKRFKELGGDIITVGSDAHSKLQVGEKLQNVRELLLEAGFKYIFTFEKREPLPLKIY